jgi:hypothetical protein
MHANLPLLTNSAQDILLKTHSALIHASTEQDIIAALALCADEGALLRLAYMDLDDAGMAGYVTVVANWRGGASWEGDPLLQVRLKVWKLRDNFYHSVSIIGGIWSV